MRLFKLERIEEAELDSHDGFVVAAWTRSEARKLARQHCGTWERSRDLWLDPMESTLTELGQARHRVEAGVILASFRAG